VAARVLSRLEAAAVCRSLGKRKSFE